jgi:acyl carrier protein
MTQHHQAKIHDFVVGLLAAHNDDEPLEDSESLFLNGRLDSLAVTQLVVFLEESFGVDFGRVEFDVGSLDSVELVAAFVERHGALAAE